MQNSSSRLGGINNPASSHGAVGALKICLVESNTAHISNLLSSSEYIGHIDHEFRYSKDGTGLMRIKNLELNEVKEFTFTYVDAISKDHFIVQNGDVDILSITFE